MLRMAPPPAAFSGSTLKRHLGLRVRELSGQTLLHTKLHSKEFECQTLKIFEKQTKPDFSKTWGRRHQPPPYQFAFC
jgi:hypothetical protein